jgi:hypothetical protein
MRLLRALPGAVLWIVASVLGLVGVVLCVTVILLPVGIPLMKIAGRMFSHAVQLMLPRAVSHPVDELDKAMDKKGRTLRSATAGAAGRAAKKSRKLGSTASETAGGALKKGRKAARKQAKSLSAS